MSGTIRQVVDDALTLVGEVAGAGVAEYSEDFMMANAIRAFNMLFTKYNWDEFIEFKQFTLDGTTGLPPADTFKYVRNFEDFLVFYKGGGRSEIPLLPKKANPFSITGTQIQWWRSLSSRDANFAAHRLQFYPLAATDVITACIKEYPHDPAIEWGWDDDMILDRDMLAYGVAFISLASDETNAGAADMHRGMMEDRYTTIMGKLSDRPIASVGRNEIPMTWRTGP